MTVARHGRSGKALLSSFALPVTLMAMALKAEKGAQEL